MLIDGSKEVWEGVEAVAEGGGRVMVGFGRRLGMGRGREGAKAWRDPEGGDIAGSGGITKRSDRRRWLQVKSAGLAGS